MKSRRRSLERQPVHGTAELLRLNVTDEASAIGTMTVDDISLGGARLCASKAVPVGTLWRLRIHAGELGHHDLVFLIRSCRPRGDGRYTLGGQHVIDPAVLLAAGDSPDRIAAELESLAKLGKSPHWEPRYHIRAEEPLVVSNLNAVNLSAESDLTCTGDIVDCTMDISGSLHAKASSLIGGTAHVLCGASLGSIGSANGVVTALVMGRSLSELSLLSAVDTELAARRAGLELKRASLAAIHTKASGGLDHGEREQLTVMMIEVQELEQRLERMESNRSKLAGRSTPHADAKLEVASAIHPGVSLGFGDSHVTFTRRLDGPVTLTATKDGGIHIAANPGRGPLALGDFVGTASLAA